MLGKAVFKNLLAMTIVPLAILLLAEGACRLLEPKNDLVKIQGSKGVEVPAWMLSDPSLAPQLSRPELIPPDLDSAAVFQFWQFYERDRDLHYRLRPGLDAWTLNTHTPKEWAEQMRWRLTSNADGFRGRRLPSAPPSPDVSLVVCMGDSSTFGWGVEESVVYPVRLEQILNTRGRGRWEVVNLGHPGYTSWQGFRLIDRVAALHPFAVVISYGGNDSMRGALPDRELWKRDHTFAARVSTVFERLALYRGLRRGILRVWDPAAKSASKDVELTPRVSVGEYVDNLRSIISTVRKAGGRPILLAIHVPDEYRDAMARVAEEAGAPLLKSGAIFSEVLPSVRSGAIYPAEVERLRSSLGDVLEKVPDLYLKVDKTHPNAIGHDVLAARLADVLTGEPQARGRP